LAGLLLDQIHLDGFHNAVGFAEDLDDALVVLETVKTQVTALAVLEPFCASWYLPP